LETARVDICYRPLRIGWAIRAGDIDAFRSAARLSFALWGGRFNPIIVVDHQEQAKSLVDVFRVDLILPVGDSETVQSFPKRFPYLEKPFFHDSVFVGDAEGGTRSQILDIHNALVHLQGKREWEMIKEQGLRHYKWAPDDPLADVFLTQFGAYPSPDEILVDYRSLLREAAESTEIEIDVAAQFPPDLFEYPSASFLSRCGLKRHCSVPTGWDSPGFYSGDASNLDDLVCYWNLKAADIPLLFVDPKHFDRYGQTVLAWEQVMRGMVSNRRDEFERGVAVWVRGGSLDEDPAKAMAEAMKPFMTL